MKRTQRLDYSGIAIAVPVTTPYERYSTRTAHYFFALTLKELIRRSGLKKEDVDGACVSSFSLAPDTAVGLIQHLGVSTRWLDHIPTGGASGVMALRRAARAVQAGDAEVVACLSADTNHVDSFRRMLGQFSNFARDASYPYGAGGPNSIFALITANYQRKFGATREDFGKIAMEQRFNAMQNPNALLRKPLSMQQYLDAKPIADPLHLFDCVMPCAGGEGFLVMRTERARDLGLPYVEVRGTIERHNAFADDAIFERGGWRVDRDDLYSQAAAGPHDMNFIQTYDDYPVIVMMHYEDLGFCGKGEGAEFVRSQRFTYDGELPNNTGGGQLSSGQAGAAGGFLGMTEAILQLTGHGGQRQVPDARLGLVAGFGMVTYAHAVCTAAAVLGVPT